MLFRFLFHVAFSVAAPRIYYIKLLEVRENYILGKIQIFYHGFSLEVPSLSLQRQLSQPHNICSSHIELLLNPQTCLVLSCQIVLAHATHSYSNSCELFKSFSLGCLSWHPNINCVIGHHASHCSNSIFVTPAI